MSIDNKKLLINVYSLTTFSISFTFSTIIQFFFTFYKFPEDKHVSTLQATLQMYYKGEFVSLLLPF